MFGLVKVLFGMVLAGSTAIYSQSSNQSYPTAITANEINGEIKARDIGDARLTTYFYTFNGSQGDIFVNVVSKNFNGDIDIFIADGLRPLSKIVVYADTSDSETGRVIYLRKPEKMILRVEGRTPNDDPAEFRIKFAGSFVAAVDTGQQEPELPDVKVSDESGIRVNSVGTIIERIAKVKPTPKPAETIAAAEKKAEEKPAVNSSNEKDNEKKAEAGSEGKKVEVVISENIPEGNITPAKPKNPPVARNRTRRRPLASRTGKKTPEPKETSVEPDKKDVTGTSKSDADAVENKPEAAKPAHPKTTPARRNTRAARTTAPPKSKEPDPLENIHLVILFKDGSKIEKPMSEVLRFSVDRGILTVISKDGTIGRYPILDVLKTTIE